MVHLRRSLFITFFSTNANTVVQFGVTLVLARLLTPAEVGIFSITSVLIGLAAVFRDFGVSGYLQTEKDLTPQKIRSALGLLLTSSWLLSALLYSASDLVADYYRQPGIGEVMRVLTISFALMPFASFFYALLTRELNAGKQAIVNAVGTVVYAITCITLALSGHSYMSLAWANVANILATVLVYIHFRPRGFRIWPSARAWREPMRFGAGAILAALVNHIYYSFPDLVLGKLSGPHNVGLYSRANGLVGIFQQVFGPTINYNALPYISANHHARVPLAPILSKATCYLTGLALPAFAVTAVFAAEIINVLYGPQWVEAAPLVGVLCLMYGLRIGYTLFPNCMMAIGRPYLAAIWSGTSVLARSALIWLLGARDIMSFALGLLIADIITAPVPAVLMARHMGWSLREQARAHLPSLALAGACAAVALLMRMALPADWPSIARVAVLGAVMVPSWLAGLVLLRHPMRSELLPLLHRFLPRLAAGGEAK